MRFMTAAVVAAAMLASPAFAQGPANAARPADARGAALPDGYRIGPDDVLIVSYWREKDMSAEVVVRPDGKITLPLLNDVDAVGSTPDQLRERIAAAASRFVESPSVTVSVKQINSRKVFITGQVEKPGAYPLAGPTTIVQVIAMAGGLREYANGKKIFVLRAENGRQRSFAFNYENFMEQRNLAQNIELKPSDTVIVP